MHFHRSETVTPFSLSSVVSISVRVVKVSQRKCRRLAAVSSMLAFVSICIYSFFRLSSAPKVAHVA